MMDQDILLHGLPAIYDDSKYIIYSPYAQKIVSIREAQLNSITTAQLNDLGLYQKKFIEPDEGVLTLIVTNQCNLACKYCYENAKFHDQKHLNLEIALAGIDYIAKKTAGRIRILFHGGEPTIDFEEIEKIYQYLNQKYVGRDKLLHLITNGNFSAELAEKVVKMGLSVTISYDGLREIQNKYRPTHQGTDSSNIVEQNIKYFIAKAVPLQILSIITSETVQLMPQIVANIYHLGVKRLRLEPLITYGRAKSCGLFPPDAGAFSQKFIECITMAANKDIKLVNSAIMNLIEPIDRYCNCSRGNNLTLTTEGNIVLCHELNDAGETEKDLRIAGAFDEANKKFILNESKIKEYDQLTCVENNPNCKTCFAKPICGGGCPTRNMTYTNKLGTLDDNLCNMRKRILREVIKLTYIKSAKR